MTLRLGETLVAGVSDLSAYRTSAAQDIIDATKQDINTSLNYSNISNCITYIPQDIKLELNADTLILKAGSKLYVPNGSGVFDYITISNDISVTPSGDNEYFIFYESSTNSMLLAPLSKCKIITSDPTFIDRETYFYYNKTTNRFIKWYQGNLTYITMPLAYIEYNNNNISFKQIFNGFGFFEEMAFALPGVKGLIPNGRNSDGTLKSIEFTVNSVLITTDISGATGGLEYYINGSAISRANFGQYTYNEQENKIVDTSGNIYTAVLLDGNAHRTSGKVDGFNPKTPFRVVDYNEFKSVIGDVESLINAL